MITGYRLMKEVSSPMSCSEHCLVVTFAAYPWATSKVLRFLPVMWMDLGEKELKDESAIHRRWEHNF